MTTSVSDARSNANDQRAHAAEVLSGSALRLQVFRAIYRGKGAVKTVENLVSQTGLTRKQVLTAGLVLANNGLVNQKKHDGQTAYEKDPFYAQNRDRIVSLAQSPERLAALPTKTRPAVRLAGHTNLSLPTRAIDVRQVSIDEIASFKAVRGVKILDYRAIPVKEKVFKEGVQAVVGEGGTFKDWGGEKNDMWTTRVILDGRRRATAMAFKGKGTKGKLTPKKMGSNGDQIQRLFDGAAELFILEYWGEVDQSVFEQMRSFAVAKSVIDGRRITYCVVDGQDSQRLIKAYPKFFKDVGVK
jgi:hypothetical protein